MIRGDAYPFESTAAVRPDGRYEFRHVPAGYYNFQAGLTGSGFEVEGDIDGLPVKISWPDPDEQPIVADMSDNEFSAISELQELDLALHKYADTWKKGFATNLNVLGPAPLWYHVTAERAGLIADVRPEDGYAITYIPGRPNARGQIVDYALSARPITFGKTGTQSFLLDQRGVIHTTSADRPATQEDPVLKD